MNKSVRNISVRCRPRRSVWGRCLCRRYITRGCEGVRVWGWGWWWWGGCGGEGGDGEKGVGCQMGGYSTFNNLANKMIGACFWCWIDGILRTVYVRGREVGCALFRISIVDSTLGEGQRIRAEGSRAEVARWIWASAPTECWGEETTGWQETPAGTWTSCLAASSPGSLLKMNLVA